MSVTLTVKVAVPAALGVPESTTVPAVGSAVRDSPRVSPVPPAVKSVTVKVV